LSTSERPSEKPNEYYNGDFSEVMGREWRHFCAEPRKWLTEALSADKGPKALVVPISVAFFSLAGALLIHHISTENHFPSSREVDTRSIDDLEREAHLTEK
jgi:hypothetical protein